MLTLGRFKLASIVVARFRLDGGAMFGVVPKVLWDKLEPPDEQNRIGLVMRSLLAIDETGGRVMLVDSGAGPKWPPDEAQRFAIEPILAALPEALGAHALKETDITDVIVTHLHFDHNGGITEWVDAPGGATRLRFPQARHWLHRRHWEYINHPTEKDRASFLERDFAALRQAPAVTGRDDRPGLVLVDGDQPGPTIDGIEWFVSRGHTPYQLLPLFRGDGASLLFTGDVVPTAGHLRPAWVMAYDLEPLLTIAEKHDILARCLRDGLLLAFPHDRQVAGARVGMEGERPMIVAALDLEPLAE